MVIPLSLSDSLLLFIFSHINGGNNLSFSMIFFARSISLLMCQCRDYPEYVHVILGILFKDLGEKIKKTSRESSWISNLS